jgi:hypothetical protein
MPYAKLNSRPPLYPEGYREVTTVPVHAEAAPQKVSGPGGAGSKRRRIQQ